MTAEDLAAMKARAEAATPEPWIYEEDKEGSSMGWIQGLNKGAHYEESLFDVNGDSAQQYINAEFCAHARTDLPALLAAYEALQKRCDEAEGLLKTALFYVEDSKQIGSLIATRAGEAHLRKHGLIEVEDGR